MSRLTRSDLSGHDIDDEYFKKDAQILREEAELRKMMRSKDLKYDCNLQTIEEANRESETHTTMTT